MKLRVFGWILIATLGVALLDYFELLGTKKTIELEARYMQYNCGKNNIDMRVISTVDYDGRYLVGKIVAPELKGLDQDKLAKLVYAKTASFRDGRDSMLLNFTLIGYVRESTQSHCSGAICFKVKKIKYASDKNFMEF